MNSSIPSDLK